MKIVIIQVFLFVNVMCDTDYFSKRALLKRAEIYSSLGGNMTLSDKEAVVNNCLMQHKFKELDYAFDNPQYFNMSQHYFVYKNRMRNSKLYKIIQRMPKGAALHLHDMALLGADYIMNLTYSDNLYVCLDQDQIHLKFADRKPTGNCSDWQLMTEVRRSATDVNKFNEKLRKRYTLVVDDPDKVYPSITQTWASFMNYFQAVYELLSYRPIWEQYIYDAMKKYREDGITYMEIRSILPQLYELDGTFHDPLVTAKCYRKAIKRFVTDYPDFSGVKIIYAPSRRVDKKVLDDYIKLARQIKFKMPEILAGFDLVGQEDLGTPLIEFVPQLLKVRDLDFFFHAGETDWYGTLTDENLIDAILLGSKRIGHGYALAKHPLLMKEVIKKNIAVEVNLISNAVLSLVRDMRNHPLNIFLANGVPVVLSSDDPGAWEAKPLSDDFYVAFLAASSKHSDLRLLKTLVTNSLKYSALDQVRKEQALNKFDLQWNTFVDEFDCLVN